ncbi:SDR family NAD(P)-dependent oxidoreductase [Nocardioides sp. NPDC051685]|uniref:SDR family NAD(P)-dependent oxidoreductase n=1 Tax=Nocardioides sp. NPDC051685 TaxID=3364334 RepID=UPI0037BC18CA
MTRNALVTGAGQGIGFGIAERLAEDGFHVYVTDYDERLAKEAADKVAGTPLVLDVTDPDSIASASTVVPALGVLVNCAGVYPSMPLMEVSREDFDRVLRVNVHGVLSCMQAFHAQLRADGAGAIVNVTSMSAHVAAPGLAAYATSKAAATMLTQQAALEFAGDSIRVNAVAPGSIQTEGTNRAVKPGEDPDPTPNIPLGRLGIPADVAKAVSFLSSDDSGYVTGQTILVDGGLVGNTFALFRLAQAAAR